MKVRGTRPMPGSLQKRAPRPCGRKGAACEGRPRASSLSSGHFAGNHRHTFGRTIPAKCIQSHRVKAVSRETLSCLCFSVWVNTLCSLLSQPHCKMVRDCSHFWTICTSFANLKGWVQCTNYSATGCGSTRAYPSMLERPRCGTEAASPPPPGWALLQRIAASSLLDAVVWQGFKVLGVPFGHPEFVKKFLQNKNSEHKVLLDRIPTIQDTQSAWLLLSFCVAARSNFFFRAVSPQFTQEFAQAHHEGVWQCLCRILSVHVDCGAQEQSGGIGFRSACRKTPAAHWASWADALKMIRDRHPAVVDIILDALRRKEEWQQQAVIFTTTQCGQGFGSTSTP